MSKKRGRTGRSFAPSPALMTERRAAVVRLVPDPCLVKAATVIYMTSAVYRPGVILKGQDWYQVRQRRNGHKQPVPQ